MRQFQKLLVLPLACVMAMSTSALAQEHVVPRDILAAAVTDHVARQDGDRDAIRTDLSQSQVRACLVTSYILGMDPYINSLLIFSYFWPSGAAGVRAVT